MGIGAAMLSSEWPHHCQPCRTSPTSESTSSDFKSDLHLKTVALSLSANIMVCCHHRASVSPSLVMNLFEWQSTCDLDWQVPAEDTIGLSTNAYVHPLRVMR